MDANTHFINEHLARLDELRDGFPCRKCYGPVIIEGPDEGNPKGVAYCDDCCAKQ